MRGETGEPLLSTSYLEQVHYYRGDHERVVELVTDNLTALPSDWVYEYFGMGAPPSVWDRSWHVMSFAQLGRFAEAAEYEAEAIRLAESTHHAVTVSVAYVAAGTLHLLKGDWAKAYREMDMRFWLERAETELKDLG